MLLKINKNTPLGITKISKIKKSTKENKNIQQFKRENTDLKNIIHTKRKIKKKILLIYNITIYP